MDSNTLEQLLIAFFLDTENAEKNYNLAEMYKELGQTATASNYYLRAAERTKDTLLAYKCLLKCAFCFDMQGNRIVTVCGLLKQAICLLPNRPEAYYHLSRIYEIRQEYIESYVYAQLGLNCPEPDVILDVNYPGVWGLIFEKAVSSWYWGKGDEARNLFLLLKDEHKDQMDETHKTTVQNNLTNLGSGPDSISHKRYNSEKRKLKHKFDGSDSIKKNYSQTYQDLFILTCLNGKKNGTYLEIGGGDPYYGNNTALLEEMGWTGVGVEYKQELADSYNNARKNKVLCKNALTLNYDEILKGIAIDGKVDFLQLDCEPSKTTFEIMLMIPFNKYKFAIITYEHDHYIDMTGMYRDKSRNYLTSLGYELVVGNVASTKAAPFEDWWVHPDLVDRKTIETLKCVDRSVTPIEEYMLIEE